MKYTSNNRQIILIHPVVSAGHGGGAKVVDHPVYCIAIFIWSLKFQFKKKWEVTNFFENCTMYIKC